MNWRPLAGPGIALVLWGLIIFGVIWGIGEGLLR